MTNSFFNPIVAKYFCEEQISYCFEDLSKRILSGETNKTFHHKEELEECIAHNFSYNKLKTTLLNLKPFHFQPYTLYKIIADKEKNYFLTVFYNDVTSSLNAKTDLPDIDSMVEEMKVCNKNFKYSANNNIIELHSINSAKTTVINNVVETFQKHQIFPVYTELWYLKSRNKQIKSLYYLKAVFEKNISKSEADSLQSDFERYLHRYIKPMSVFDIVGPAMVGPSSSHTAGANKIGNIARNILIAWSENQNCKIDSISIKLLGSFRDTGPGHRTPAAIGGGLWGFATDHQEMLNHGDPDFLNKNGIDLGKQKAKFSGYIRGTSEEDEFYKNENNNNIAEIQAFTKNGKIVITGFSIGGGNVELRYFNGRLSTPLTGKETFYIANGLLLTESEAKKIEIKNIVNPIYLSKGKGKHNYMMPVNSFEELWEYLKETGKELIELILEIEQNLQGSSKEDIFETTANYWKIMQKAVVDGVNSKELSLLKLTGKNAGKIYRFVDKNPLFDNLFGRAVAYATAVNEVNAKSGVIVACPTAGSCGLLPGVIQAYNEIANPPQQKLYESILVAGFFGMILFNDVTTAGADYGCQAEVGVGAAMAAASLAYLENGDTQQTIQAFILAIKNSLGLICDPVAGLVEVPCVKRNGIFASVAVSSALMALSGVKSFVSPDEVILTMKEVGDKLHRDFKETAGGGLAKTRDGKAVDKAFECEVSRFFGQAE
ncbi:MAG: L-serine ammonia-lyase, iron-sulfur-dependent, subunit alpha [Bacteroidales bacterium]|nr:L-serine ammonia-lyase, iron-sulfur-dependent, subunit alpha [Bacteroidales bacterium]